MPKLFIPVILGTAREGRHSEKAARAVFETLQKYEEVETEFIDVREWVKIPVTYAPWMNSPMTKPWQELVARADGFIVVTPEYNHGYPGELKILIDYAYSEYEKKTLAMATVSGGELGGARVIEQMQAMWNYLKMIVVPEPLRFSNIQELFDEKGNLLHEEYKERIEKFLNKMIEYTRDIKEIREKV